MQQVLGRKKRVGRYFFPFLAGFLGADFFAGFGASLVAGVCVGLASFGAGFTFSAALAFGFGFVAGAAGGGTATGAAAAFPFFPFGPGFPGAAGVPAAPCAAAFGARPRLGAGGGGGGGGANGFRNFSVSVRERSLPSSRSMNTSWAIFGYSGSCAVISSSVISGNGIF